MSNSTDAKTKADVFLKPKQVEQMRTAAYDGRNGTRDDALIALLYDTGLRRKEASLLDRGMLDLQAQELRIPSTIQKDYPTDRSPSNATFEIDPTGDIGTVRALRSYLDSTDSDGPLFVSQKGNRLSAKAINRAVKQAAERAEIKPYTHHGRGHTDAVTAHTLRHSVAWRMLRIEEDNTLYDVRNRLRHASITTTERVYDHYDVI